MNKMFWHIVATVLGSMICLIWLSIIDVILIFVTISVTKILLESLNKKNK